MKAPVNRARAGKITVEREPCQLRHLRRNFVGHHRNDAASAKRHDRQRDGVVAGENEEVSRHGVQNRSHLRDAARGFLDANDFFNVRKALYCGWFTVHAGTALHAIQNNRQRNSFRDGAIMLEQSFRRRLVVIRRHRKNSIGAKSGQFARQRNHLRGVITASTRENRHLPLGQSDGDLNDLNVLCVFQRRALARCAAWHGEVDTCVNLPLDQGSQRWFVQRTIASNWSDKSRACTCKHVPFLSFPLTSIPSESPDTPPPPPSPRPSSHPPPRPAPHL